MSSLKFSVSRPAWRRWILPAAWIVVTVFVIMLPLLGLDRFWIRQILLVAVMGLLVSGLNLSLGWAGELNMGIPAMYAAGAYVTAYVSSRIFNDILLSFALSILAAVIVGLLAGAPGLKLGGWMLAVCTFLLVGLIPVTLQIVPFSILGGQSGFTGIPQAQIFGNLINRDAFFAVVIISTSIWFALYRNSVKSSFGRSLLVLKHSEVLAPSLGMSRYGLKLTTYAFAAIPAGIAGTLFAYTDLFISPESLGLALIINLLVASIVAGQRSIYAIFVGVIFVQFVASFSSQFGEFGQIAFGVFLVIGGLAFGGGVAGIVARFLRKRNAPSADPGPANANMSVPIPPLSGKDLRLESVSKVFGGVTAVNDVSLVAKAGEITALIGPNGSGKTTTLNMINGFEKPTRGRITLGDQDITGRPAMEVARRGVARTFQTPAVPTDLTVLDVVETGRIEAHRPSLWSTVLRLPKYRRTVRADRDAARTWLEMLGLASIADLPASSMSLGTRRMIELARALCAGPSLLLLDEVASGLDTDEVQELATVLRRVRAAGATIVLVEHNFSLVQSLADHVVVLAEGAVLTDGPPNVIAEHPEVLVRFLGSGSGISGTTISTEGSTPSREHAGAAEGSRE